MEQSAQHKQPNRISQQLISASSIPGWSPARWEQWFDGLTITLEENGNTLLSGPLADQAALHGILKKVRDLGLTLLSVNSVEPDTKEVRKT